MLVNSPLLAPIVARHHWTLDGDSVKFPENESNTPQSTLGQERIEISRTFPSLISFNLNVIRMEEESDILTLILHRLVEIVGEKSSGLSGVLSEVGCRIKRERDLFGRLRDAIFNRISRRQNGV